LHKSEGTTNTRLKSVVISPDRTPSLHQTLSKNDQKQKTATRRILSKTLQKSWKKKHHSKPLHNTVSAKMALWACLFLFVQILFISNHSFSPIEIHRKNINVNVKMKV